MIECFYSAHSAFAYFGSSALMQIAADTGARIVHRPMDLRAVVAAAKGGRFDGYSDAHMAYFFGVEIDRWAAYRDAPVMGHNPTHHANDLTLSNCLLIAAAEQGAPVDQLAHENRRYAASDAITSPQASRRSSSGWLRSSFAANSSSLNDSRVEI